MDSRIIKSGQGIYRIASGQSNLFHAGRIEYKSCRRLSACRGYEETMVHLFWKFQSTAALWDKLVTYWTRERASRLHTRQFFDASASRQFCSHLSTRRGIEPTVSFQGPQKPFNMNILDDEGDDTFQVIRES
uniref:RxLR effector candidate protein n=1 Tax=Hyaloperonospora arabidopsidis (strain Emoy2) TaxID=559515 RepID=M4C4F0_HYAAE